MKVVSLQLPSGPSMERLPLPFSPTELLWRYPLPWAPPPPSPLGDTKAQLPAGLPPEPRLWTREDVAVFLKWCEREFDLPNFDMDLFQMNGKALCLLTKTDLGERCPGAGDVLHNVLQMLVRDAALLGRVPSSPVTPTARAAPYPPSPHSHPPTPTWAVDGFHHFHSAAAAAAAQPNSVTLSPAPSVDSSGSPQRGETLSYASAYAAPVPVSAQATSSGSNHSDSDEEAHFAPPPRSPKETPMTSPAPQNHSAPQHTHYRAQHREFFPNDMPESNTNGRLLWDFLQQLLNDPTQRYTNYIAWKNRDTGVFKIVDPAGLAKLWGIQKNHLSMNYDKMSRALRYYYRVNILRKVQGERHCYQFLRNPTELKNIKNISLLRQQMSPTRVAPPPVVKTEMKEERCEDEHVEDDMPTDLSMATSEPWRKRARSDNSQVSITHDKHRISALIGDNMMLKRDAEYNPEHYALNLKSEKCEQ